MPRSKLTQIQPLTVVEVDMPYIDGKYDVCKSYSTQGFRLI
jgi:hypothetical protein